MIVISDALSLIQVRLGFVLFNNAEMIALPIALREAHRLQIDQLMACVLSDGHLDLLQLHGEWLI